MKSAHPQFEKDFQSRLEDWVSRQGLWFQIRHASGGGDLVRSLLGIGFRLVILFLILLVIGWFYLTKQVGTNGYNEKLKAGVVQGLNGSGGKMEGISRGNSQLLSSDLKIKRLEVMAGETSFFENRVIDVPVEEGDENAKAEVKEEGLVVEGVTLSPLKIYDGIRGGWRGNELHIQSLSAVLKTTDESDEVAKASYQSLFKKHPYMDVKILDVGKVNLEWGYSEKTKGAVRGASMSGELLEEGWQLVFKGGTFSYGFIRDANLIEVKVLCKPDGIEIRSGLVRMEKGAVAFKGEIEIGAKPRVDGHLRLSSVALSDVTDPEYHSWLQGSVSGEGSISGDLGAQEGLDYDLQIELSRRDELVVEDKFPVMQTMQFVDAMNSYRRFRFGNGRLRFRTEGSKVFLDKVFLRAGILLYLSGNLEMETKEKEEVTEEVEVEDDEGNVTTKTRVVDTGGLQRYYRGDLVMSLPKGVFARSEPLRKEFLLDDDGKADFEDDPERYEIPLKVDSFFDGISKELAERIDRIHKGRKNQE